MSSFAAELHKLRNLQQNFEKTEDTFLQQVKKLDEAPQINDFYKESDASNKSLVKKLQNDAIRIFVPLKRIKQLVKHEQVDNIDLSELKTQMIAIQNNIQHLRQNSKGPLETLQKEEAKFTEELKMFEEKLKEWDKPSVISSHKMKPIKTKHHFVNTSLDNICPEVKEFMNFLNASGGEENGWPLEDHRLFLKTRAKTKDPKKIAAFLHTMLPDISENEILVHEDWYQVYLELRDKQKNAIKNWRDNKEKKTAPEPQIVQAQKNHKLFEIDKSEIKREKVEQWKALKCAEERSKYEIDHAIQMKLKIKEDNKRAKQQEIKKKVESWKEKRRALVEAEEMKNRTAAMKYHELRAQEANRLIKEYRNQDKLLIKRKQITHHFKTKSPKAKKRVEAQRDLNRLLKPTKQWLMKSHGNTHKEKKSDMHINSIPKLRTPEWREVLKSL